MIMDVDGPVDAANIATTAHGGGGGGGHKRRKSRRHAHAAKVPSRYPVVNEEVAQQQKKENGLEQVMKNFDAGRMQAFGSRQVEVLKGIEGIRQQQLQLARDHMNLSLAVPFFASDADGVEDAEDFRAEMSAFFAKKEQSISVLSEKLHEFVDELRKEGDNDGDKSDDDHR